MSYYKPIDLLKSLRGKICEHSDFYLANKGKTGYSGRMCNQRDLSKNPYSEKELQQQQRYKQAIEALKTLGTEQKEAYEKQWKAQKHSKYSTLRGFMFAQEYAKLKNA